MRIEKASPSMLEDVLRIYAEAREFMCECGNREQWRGGYPPESLVRADIECGRLYAVTDGGTPIAVFFFSLEADATYARIYDGEWKNDAPYGVIHRVAVGSLGRGLGISSLIFSYCKEHADNLRIDTHNDNIPMQKALAKAGFEYCGIIHLASGDVRLAYQYSKDN